MKNNSQKNIDSLFQKAKDIPTEIPFEKMEKMIMDFPDHPVPTTESQWFVKLFNLKYIAMTIIPFITVLAFWLVPVQPETTASFTETEVQNVSEAEIVLPEIPMVTDTENLTLAESKTATATLPEPITPLAKITDLPNSKTETDDLIKINSSINTITELNAIEEKTLSHEKKKLSSPGTTTYIKPALIAQEPTPLSDISSPRLKKLRRTLYKNLMDDGLIMSKHILVKMQLLENQILVNGKPIPEKLLLKYKGLTNIVGAGPERAINMHPKFILAGDFTEDGFKGHGVGRFEENIMESNKLSDQLFGGDTNPFKVRLFTEKSEKEKEYLEMESKALDNFANEIQQNTPDYSGRKRLFSPNLKGKNTKNLHTELTLILTEDNFINDQNEFACIQLPKGIIRVNGQELSGDQFKKYQKLIDEYRIKHGRERMIMLSPHTLKVGDYNYGNFSGTVVILPFED